VAALAALRRIVAEAGQTATVVARVPLGPPLEGFVLAAELPGDPAAPLAFRNRTLYIALLFLLYLGDRRRIRLTIREMRRAYKLSRLKTDFVANISHELRTPLTSVRLFAETLREGRAEALRVRECVAMHSARRTGSRAWWEAARLVAAGAGRGKLELEKTESHAPGPHRRRFRAQQLPAEYETQVEPQLPPVNVDRDRMAQVVLNSCTCGEVHGDDKRIRVRAAESRRATCHRGEDNGPGVAAPRCSDLRAVLPGVTICSPDTEGTAGAGHRKRFRRAAPAAASSWTRGWEKAASSA